MTVVILWTVAALSVIVPVYALWLRKRLKPKPWMAWLYRSKFGEWFELTFFKKSETILFGRFLQFVGYVLTSVAGLGDVDLTPFYALFPESLAWLPPLMPLIISLCGHAVVALRLDTTKPVEQVALPEAVKPETPMATPVPEVTAKIKAAEIANQEVAEAIEAAKATGAV